MNRNISIVFAHGSEKKKKQPNKNQIQAAEDDAEEHCLLRRASTRLDGLLRNSIYFQIQSPMKGNISFS